MCLSCSTIDPIKNISRILSNFGIYHENPVGIRIHIPRFSVHGSMLTVIFFNLQDRGRKALGSRLLGLQQDLVPVHTSKTGMSIFFSIGSDLGFGQICFFLPDTGYPARLSGMPCQLLPDNLAIPCRIPDILPDYPALPGIRPDPN